MKIIKFVAGAVLSLVLAAVLAIAGFAAWFTWASAEVGAAYGTKILGTGVFVAGRTPESVVKEELGFVPFFKYAIDEDAKTVTGWTINGHRRTAVYREGLGVALAHDGDIEGLRAMARPNLIPDLSHMAAEPWPMGDAPSGRGRPEGIDEAALKTAIDRAFLEPNRFYPRRTRAVLVLYDGEIVAERYADGFGPDSRLAAWSMTKSMLHAMVGIAVRDGKLSVSEKLPYWQTPGDPRAEINVDMLMRMSSGLSFGEFDFIPPSDLTDMIFLSDDTGGYAASLPLEHAPDTVWAYASGTSNILSKWLRETCGDDAYYALAYDELFAKLGMRSAIIETDPSGTFVASSLGFATARDYARFGLLYLNDGVWNGERILPEGWVDYGRTRSEIDQPGPYGAQWWLHSGGPEDSYRASGFEGQVIVVIPSRKVVIVRLGLQYFSPFHPAEFVDEVLSTLPEPAATTVAESAAP